MYERVCLASSHEIGLKGRNRSDLLSIEDAIEWHDFCCPADRPPKRWRAQSDDGHPNAAEVGP